MLHGTRTIVCVNKYSLIGKQTEELGWIQTVDPNRLCLCSWVFLQTCCIVEVPYKYNLLRSTTGHKSWSNWRYINRKVVYSSPRYIRPGLCPPEAWWVETLWDIFSSVGKHGGRRGRTESLIRRKPNSWEAAIGGGKLDPHTSPVHHLLLFLLAFHSAGASQGRGDSTRTTMGQKCHHLQSTQWGWGRWGSPPEPRLWPEERHGRWQLETSPSLLTSALLPTLILPPPPCPTGAQTTVHWPGRVPPLIHLGPEKAWDSPVWAGCKAAATTYKSSYGWLGEWEAGVIVILTG